MQKTQVWFLGQEDPLEEGNSNPVQYSCLGKPIAWWATVRGVTKESDMRVTKQKNPTEYDAMLPRLQKGSDSNCEIMCVQCCGRERVSRTESRSSPWDYKAWGGDDDSCRDSCREPFHPAPRVLSSPNRKMATLVSSAQSPLRNSHQVGRDDQLSKVLGFYLGKESVITFEATAFQNNFRKFTCPFVGFSIFLSSDCTSDIYQTCVFHKHGSSMTGLDLVMDLSHSSTFWQPFRPCNQSFSQTSFYLPASSYPGLVPWSSVNRGLYGPNHPWELVWHHNMQLHRDPNMVLGASHL